jgi:hypothetical protein
LEYIEASFTDGEVRKLLNDAFLFNPWLSKKEDGEGDDEIPAKVRQELIERRKQWMEQHGRGNSSNGTMD